MQEAENHDLLQPLVHVTGGNCEDVNCVGIVFRAELLVILDCCFLGCESTEPSCPL